MSQPEHVARAQLRLVNLVIFLGLLLTCVLILPLFWFIGLTRFEGFGLLYAKMVEICVLIFVIHVVFSELLLCVPRVRSMYVNLYLEPYTYKHTMLLTGIVVAEWINLITSVYVLIGNGKIHKYFVVVFVCCGITGLWMSLYHVSIVERWPSKYPLWNILLYIPVASLPLVFGPYDVDLLIVLITFYFLGGTNCLMGYVQYKKLMEKKQETETLTTAL